MTANAVDVAAWMLERINADGALYQDVAASQIASHFGEAFVTINIAGNVGISKAVLAAFNKSSGDSVVWCRGERYWRLREDYDLPGRQQP